MAASVVEAAAAAAAEAVTIRREAVVMAGQWPGPSQAVLFYFILSGPETWRDRWPGWDHCEDMGCRAGFGFGALLPAGVVVV